MSSTQPTIMETVANSLKGMVTEIKEDIQLIASSPAPKKPRANAAISRSRVTKSRKSPVKKAGNSKNKSRTKASASKSTQSAKRVASAKTGSSASKRNAPAKRSAHNKKSRVQKAIDVLSTSLAPRSREIKRRVSAAETSANTTMRRVARHKPGTTSTSKKAVAKRSARTAKTATRKSPTPMNRAAARATARSTRSSAGKRSAKKR